MNSLRSDWTCPYCHARNVSFWDDAERVKVAYCDLDLGGCDGLVVLLSKQVIVEVDVKRVEGEGAAEDGGAMPIVEPVPVAEHRPLQVETDDAPTLAELPDEVIEQLVNVSTAAVVPAISAEAKAVLGPENVVLEPLHTNGHGPIKFKWTGFDHEVGRLQVRRDFTMLPRSTRVRIIDLCGQQIAAHVLQPPTLAQWDEFKPSWMPKGTTIYQGYFEGSWPERAQEWHLRAKGLAK